MFLHNNFSHEFEVTNDNPLGNLENGTYKYAIFEYDDDLDTNGLYAGATTLDAIYQAGITDGQTDAFQDEDNNQAIEDFIKEAIDSQEVNNFTTTPGSDPINVAIFTHNPAENVSYNASDTEVDYADETAAYNQGYDDGVAQGISQSQIQYPDIYIQGEADLNYVSLPFDSSFYDGMQTNNDFFEFLNNSLSMELVPFADSITVRIGGVVLFALYLSEAFGGIFRGWSTSDDFTNIPNGAALSVNFINSGNISWVEPNVILEDDPVEN